MQQRTCRSNKIEYSHSKQHIMAVMIYWTLVVIALFQQMQTTEAAKFKGDTCVSKNQPGICKEWSECPVIKTLIDNGEYTNREVISCGFGIREELICCPVRKNDPTTETSTVENKDSFPEPTTTQATVRDFWMDLLENTTTSTTAAPDFWLDLLTPTIPASTTTTTTIKPLIVGDQKLNESSEFFDFNALLIGNQSGASKLPTQTNAQNTRPNNNPSSQGGARPNDNGRGNLHTGPININQWGMHQTGNNFNNGPGSTNFDNGRGHSGHMNFHENGNGNGNSGWGLLDPSGPFNIQQNINRGHNMGRGPHNNNGRGPHNNGRVRNNFGMGNQNHGFIFPENNLRPNNLFDTGDSQTRRPGRPVNNMQEQNPNLHFASFPNNNNNEPKKIDDLIKNVFVTPSTANANAEPTAAVNENKATEKGLDDAIANIFNVNKPQIEKTQPTVWLATQDNINKHEPHHQMELINGQAPGFFEILPVAGHQISSNDLDTAPSTNFIQQPVLVETWSANPATGPHFDPVQVVYENFVNSGMNIVKAQESQVEHIFNQQQHEHFAQQQTQQFNQQPQFNHQQVLVPHNFRQVTQQFVQTPQQMESSGKEARSTAPLQHQPNPASTIIVQSPPTQILDPFKPFEFRPPPEDERTFSEDNNSLSPGPTSIKPDTNKDRPAVRACRRIERGLTASLSPHILGGVPVELGEFPHMAAIGYSRIGGDDRPPYDIRCGGTLIDKRFVLTAAHCVSERENVPSIVRLGVVNFTDATQMSAAVELRIKETYIHDEYLTRLTYNDIAILELERDVEFSEYIYPVCLYMDEKDPDTKIKLWVTGWGTVNTTTRSFSNILLKAPLHTSPLENCNASFTDYGLNRRIPEGIIRTQFCAEDKDQIKDACQGDSGGPLNMVIDESYKKYRLVGVVSSGFGCASSTPGLYTRVAAFLDFIEKIVWPNGGD